MTDHDTSTEQATPTDISAIKLFAHVRRAIKAIDTPPLTESALELNGDAYKELGIGTSEGVVFAHIGITFAKNYTDLIFDMAFSEEGVAVCLAGTDYIFSHYEHLGSDEKDIADKLVRMLTGLANGQLGMLTTITQDDERVQAWEILYRQAGEQLYDAIATYPTFESARKLRDRQLTTQKFANAAPIDDVIVDLETVKAFIFETKWQDEFNRKQIPGLHIPLTREAWEKSVNAYYEKKADDITAKVDAWANKDTRSGWQQVVDATKWRHIELMWWSLALMAYQPIVKGSIESLPFGFYVFGMYVIAATIYRNNPTFHKYFTSIRLGAYAGFFLATIIYTMYYDGSLWWILLGAVSLVTFLECVFFDIYEQRTRKRAE